MQADKAIFPRASAPPRQTRGVGLRRRPGAWVRVQWRLPLPSGKCTAGVQTSDHHRSLPGESRVVSHQWLAACGQWFFASARRGCRACRPGLVRIGRRRQVNKALLPNGLRCTWVLGWWLVHHGFGDHALSPRPARAQVRRNQRPAIGESPPQGGPDRGGRCLRGRDWPRACGPGKRRGARLRHAICLYSGMTDAGTSPRTIPTPGRSADCLHPLRP
jgi:hypothetical protein